MTLEFPELSLVVLIGPSGSGKSTFAARHFLPTEVVSSDACRSLICDDENSPEVNEEAFHVLDTIVRTRLKLGKLTVIDATNVEPVHRKKFVALAREYHVLPCAVVFKLPDSVSLERNKNRPDRNFGSRVVKRQISMMRQGLRKLKSEGFRSIHTFESESDVDAVQSVVKRRMWCDRRDEDGPFDVIGDVHGCAPELRELVTDSLGYDFDEDSFIATHPEGRRIVFVGDLADRGPDSPWCLRFAMENVKAGTALCVPGNHDDKLKRWLQGRNVSLTHGLELTVEQLSEDSESAPDKRELADFLDDLVSHLVLAEGKLVVSHAGILEEMQGRGSGKVRQFCLYGDTTGETDEFGLPERLDWASNYRGKALVVYGHTPFADPRWLNNTVNIDTGCVFGGKLSALRFPELEIVSVPARETYAESRRPFLPTDGATNLSAQQLHDQILDLKDLTGKTAITTRWRPNIALRPENAAAALEVMSRFAVDPRWLIYLPPTMSPCATSNREGWLERPEEAFSYFKTCGVETVVCEEKHMGSRAVVIVGRDADALGARFGFEKPPTAAGTIFTRTGRPFFTGADAGLENDLLDRLAVALEKAGLWEELQTDWLCLDCELMPWSFKARELIRSQYANVGAAGTLWNAAALQSVRKALQRDLDNKEDSEKLIRLQSRLDQGSADLAKYRAAYANYCAEVGSVDDLQLAPFHFLAGEGRVFTGRDHHWHMTLADRLAESGGTSIIQKTNWHSVRLDRAGEIESAIEWWEKVTESGGEGMVVKPLHFLTRDRRNRIVQPAVKCRGREYLRIIYGPTYTQPEHLDRLRNRGLSHKRSMAEREFLLGLEALERFTENRPLREIHECVFSLLAMESEPVDPRL